MLVTRVFPAKTRSRGHEIDYPPVRHNQTFTIVTLCDRHADGYDIYNYDGIRSVVLERLCALRYP